MKIKEQETCLTLQEHDDDGDDDDDDENCFKFHNNFNPLFIRIQNENENFIDGKEISLETKGLILHVV